MKSAKIQGIEEVELVICNVDGLELVFTSDGKLLPNQGCTGHFYYVNGNERYKTLRTAFIVDHRKIKVKDADDFLVRNN